MNSEGRGVITLSHKLLYTVNSSSTNDTLSDQNSFQDFTCLIPSESQSVDGDEDGRLSSLSSVLPEIFRTRRLLFISLRHDKRFLEFSPSKCGLVVRCHLSFVEIDSTVNENNKGKTQKHVGQNICKFFSAPIALNVVPVHLSRGQGSLISSQRHISERRCIHCCLGHELHAL